MCNNEGLDLGVAGGDQKAHCRHEELGKLTLDGKPDLEWFKGGFTLFDFLRLCTGTVNGTCDPVILEEIDFEPSI